jgi:hypothetical protein
MIFFYAVEFWKAVRCNGWHGGFVWRRRRFVWSWRSFVLAGAVLAVVGASSALDEASSALVGAVSDLDGAIVRATEIWEKFVPSQFPVIFKHSPTKTLKTEAQNVLSSVSKHDSLLISPRNLWSFSPFPTPPSNFQN